MTAEKGSGFNLREFICENDQLTVRYLSHYSEMYQLNKHIYMKK